MKLHGGCVSDVMAKVHDNDIIVSELEPYSRYYVEFRTNIEPSRMEL